MSISPYDETPPRRPGIDDVGGGNKLDDAINPPDEVTMATASDFNIMGRLDVAHGNVAPFAILSVEFSGGTPAISFLSTLSTTLLISDFTVTDNGDGDTSITWAAGKFPAPGNAPSGLTLNEDLEIDAMRAIALTNGVRVVTNLASTGTDCAFTVCVH